MLPLLLTTLALAQDDELYMADMGVTASLPVGWTVPRWSDWDLDAVDDASSVQVHLDYTLWQVPPSPDAARMWALRAADTLREEGHDRVEMERTEVVERGGVSMAEVDLSFRYQGKQQAVLRQRSWNVDGRTLHLRAVAMKSRQSRAEAALETWWSQLEASRPATDLSGLDDFATDVGFSTSLPAGWRNPVQGEVNETRRLASELLKHELDGERCFWAVHPYPDGEAALLMSCDTPLYVGVIDEHSWSGQEEGLREHFFRGVALAAAEQVEAGPDARLAFLYTLPEVQDRVIKMGVTPYDHGMALTWVVSRPKDGGDGDLQRVDSVAHAAMNNLEFSGPEAGRHPVGAALYLDYLLTYRRTSPMVLGPAAALLLLLGLVGFKVTRRKPGYDELD